jgi:5-hydroxyisourate hydrolase
MAGGRLTTHVLDTTSGKPGAGLRIDLYRLDREDRIALKTVLTNDDGRCDDPLLTGDEFALGIVPVRFGVSTAGQHYHVPLLISPFSYSTYRGS